MSDTQNTSNGLSSAVAAKYTLHGVNGGKVVLPVRYGSQRVDFSTMTVTEADELVAKYKDFPYLKPKVSAPAK